MLIDPVIDAMKTVFQDAPYGIEHTLRVLANAERILAGEAATPALGETTRLAAVLHDIGALEAQRKHGSMAGHLQEIEGPPIARAILERAGAPPATVERVCYIVAHHHTFSAIDGLDFQILWEADDLENLQFGDEKDPAALSQRVAQGFRTAAGRALARERLGIAGE